MDFKPLSNEASEDHFITVGIDYPDHLDTTELSLRVFLSLSAIKPPLSDGVEASALRQGFLWDEELFDESGEKGRLETSILAKFFPLRMKRDTAGKISIAWGSSKRKVSEDLSSMLDQALLSNRLK